MVCPVNDKIEDNMNDRLWRLRNLYFILDDKGQRIKFNPNPVQLLLYWALWWLNVILKSRQHGVTTFVCIYFLDACLFKPNVRAGIIAHKLADAKKIFRDKIKFAYDNLPESIKAKRTLLKDDTSELVFSNNSSIYVGTSMRSGTLQYLHISEYGYVCAHAPQKAREIKTGAMETVHEGGMIIIESTAEGVGNDFHSLCTASEKKVGEELTRMDYKFHFFGWYLKPENQLHDNVEISQDMSAYFQKVEMTSGVKIGQPHRNWYVKKKESLREDMYKEHPSTADEAFLASLEGSYYANYMIRAKEEGRIGFVPQEQCSKVHTFWDTGDMHTAIWFVQFIQGRIDCIDFYFDNSGIGWAGYAKVLQTKPYVYGQHFCGPDLGEGGGNRKSGMSGRVELDMAAELGIHIKPIESHRVADRIKCVQGLLGKCRFDKDRCSEGVRGLFNYHKEKEEALSTPEQIVFKKTPAKDNNTHVADAFGHMALAYRYEVIGDDILGYQGAIPEWESRADDGVEIDDLLEV